MKYFQHLTLRTFSLFLPTVLLWGCQKETAFDCVKSTGSIQTQQRPLPPFHTIRLFDNANVTLVAGPEFWAEVKAGENLQSNLRTEVRNGELWIENINRCNWVRSYNKPVEITISTPDIGTIFHDGSGTFLSQGTVPADTLFLHVTGAGDLDLTLNTSSLWLDMYELGDIKLRGNNQELVAYVLSLGSLKASELSNQNVYLKLTDEGQANLNASQFLGAQIEGNGNVYYHNQPQKTERTGSGKGQLLKAN